MAPAEKEGGRGVGRAGMRTDNAVGVGDGWKRRRSDYYARWEMMSERRSENKQMELGKGATMVGRRGRGGSGRNNSAKEESGAKDTNKTDGM